MRIGILVVPLLVALAGCTGEDAGDDDGTTPTTTATTSPSPTASEAVVDVGDDYFEVRGAAGTRNGQTTADVGQTFLFDTIGDHPHTVTIHKVGDPLDTWVVDEDVTVGDEVRFTFEEATTYHVWCKRHGEMTSGMHLTVVVS